MTTTISRKARGGAPEPGAPLMTMATLRERDVLRALERMLERGVIALQEMTPREAVGS